MRKILSIIACVAASLSATATVYDSYYTDLPVELARVTPVTFPEARANIVDDGAQGDGVTLCTEAIQHTIDRLAASGGGTVVVPAGVWLTGPLTLRSNINLHLERNAVLYFSPDKSLYVDPSPRASRVLPCITASKCTNIGITGEGIIDGNGAQWRPVKRGKMSDVEWSRYTNMGGELRDNGKLWYPWQLKSGYPDIESTPERQEKKRNDLVRLFDCENILLTGVTLQNAPKFHVHPFNSRNIIIDGITVRCPWNAQNGDAIDISDCHQVLIVNSVVDAGDDGLCMKSGNAKKGTDINGCRDILIQDNIVYHAHGGFVIGSEDICGMERIVVRDCTFSGTDTGLRFKSGVGRGGLTNDIYISNIMMADIASEAIVIQCDYVDRPAGAPESAAPVDIARDKVPVFAGIHISDVVCRGCRTAIKAAGIAGADNVRDITVSNSTFVYERAATEIDTATARITLTDCRFVLDHK